MGHILHRITKEFRRSVNDSDVDSTEWIINPDLSAVENVPTKYWIIENDTVRAATLEEQAEIDRVEG